MVLRDGRHPARRGEGRREGSGRGRPLAGEGLRDARREARRRAVLQPPGAALRRGRRRPEGPHPRPVLLQARLRPEVPGGLRQLGEVRRRLERFGRRGRRPQRGGLILRPVADGGNMRTPALLIAIFVSGGALVQGQSLGEAAAKEKERRSKIHGSRKSFSDSDLQETGANREREGGAASSPKPPAPKDGGNTSA